MSTASKFGLSEKHTKFEKIFLIVLTKQLIYLVNVKTMRKIFFKLCVLLKRSELWLCFNVCTSTRSNIFLLFYRVFFSSSRDTFQLVFGFNFIWSNDKVWQGKLIDFWMRHPVPLASFTHDVQRAVTKIDQHRIIPVMLRYKRVFLSTKMPKWGQNRYEAAFDFQ